jgi:RNA polymerase II subunit A-like phosphatase
MSRFTVSGITVTVSDQEGQRMAEQDAECLHRQRKLSLVLDLDHSLLHATNDVRARQHLNRDDVRSLVLPIWMEESPTNGGTPAAAANNNHNNRLLWMQHFVNLRPHIKTFLQQAMEMYEIGVYTAGTRQYAEQVTLLLARHLLLVTEPHQVCRDQVELDHLRHVVAQTEQEKVAIGTGSPQYEY